MPSLRVHFTAEDRERFGCDEHLDFDYLYLMQLESEVLQQEVAGFDPDAWFDFLGAHATNAWRHVMVWLALRRNGIRVPYAETDFRRHGTRFEFIADAEPEGKDDGSIPARTPNRNGDATSPSSPTSLASDLSDRTGAPSSP